MYSSPCSCWNKYFYSLPSASSSISEKSARLTKTCYLQLLKVTWLSSGTAPVGAEHLWKSQEEVG